MKYLCAIIVIVSGLAVMDANLRAANAEYYAKQVAAENKRVHNKLFEMGDSLYLCNQLRDQCCD